MVNEPRMDREETRRVKVSSMSVVFVQVWMSSSEDEVDILIVEELIESKEGLTPKRMSRKRRMKLFKGKY